VGGWFKGWLPFFYIKLKRKERGEKMAAATMTMEPIIKTAMSKIGLDDRTDELLAIMDKIELDMNLAESLKQAERGETISLEEAKRQVKEKLASGYYRR
jgi:hypothetical protein